MRFRRNAASGPHLLGMAMDWPSNALCRDESGFIHWVPEALTPAVESTAAGLLAAGHNKSKLALPIICIPMDDFFPTTAELLNL